MRAALDAETMTDIAQRAIGFYLSHPDIVEHYEEIHGQSHRVYSCPDCSSPVVLREGEIVSLRKQSGVLVEEALSMSGHSQSDSVSVGVDSQGEGELVPVCS
ncbi:hypothetical protein [Leptothermofonsia sp. ETS-13]|uniref:hypothetical protein n=1 Tax=Leptothermofonsia sp. ETS-13 TaxID=3035696 RepID=UPI003BA36089